MKIANLSGRLHLIREGRALDVAKASEGRLPADPADAYRHWPELVGWADRQPDEAFAAEFDQTCLQPPSPSPRQVFAVGTNYRGHANELGWPIPEVPMVFAKFPSSLAGPGARIEVTGPQVDWEVELVVVSAQGGTASPPNMRGRRSRDSLLAKIFQIAKSRSARHRPRSSASVSRFPVSHRSVRSWSRAMNSATPTMCDCAVGSTTR
jgi:Fumarylacetoacetate (FAA) hydrolase family